jgi:hypothetical protein
MVSSSALTVTSDGEHLSYNGFSHGETICFGSLEFIVDYFRGMSLSPRRDGSDTAIMGSTRNGPLSPLQVMIGDSTEEFHMASDREGGIDLPSPRRDSTEASPAPATTISWLKDTSTTQATVTIPPR